MQKLEVSASLVNSSNKMQLDERSQINVRLEAHSGGPDLSGLRDHQWCLDDRLAAAGLQHMQ